MLLSDDVIGGKRVGLTDGHVVECRYSRDIEF